MNLPPAARNTDPTTSHAAAEDVTSSGVRAVQMMRVFAGVKSFPGRTSRELAELVGIERHAAARRTADLEHLGMVRKGPSRVCTLGGRPAVTWYVRDSSPEGTPCLF